MLITSNEPRTTKKDAAKTPSATGLCMQLVSECRIRKRPHVRERDVACPSHDYDNKCHEKSEHARVWWTGQAGSFQSEKERGHSELKARRSDPRKLDDFN